MSINRKNECRESLIEPKKDDPRLEIQQLEGKIERIKHTLDNVSEKLKVERRKVINQLFK